jgi:hypothetical protein
MWVVVSCLYLLLYCRAHWWQQGRIQDFKLGGALKKLRRAEGGANIFWGISWEKSRFYAKKSYFFRLRREARKCLGYFLWKITILRQKIIFFPIAEGGAKIFGVFRVKNHDFTPKKHIFSNFKGGAAPVRPPPLDPPLEYTSSWVGFKLKTLVVIGTDCICNHKSN